MKTISFMNKKGGVGKTTSTVTAAKILADKGYRVLVVDIDSQGNATEIFNIDTEGKNTVFEVIKGEATLAETIQPGVEYLENPEPGQKPRSRGVDVVPADGSLADLTSVGPSLKGLDSRLKKALATVADDYDFCFIDCPPSLSYETVNALTASDYVIIPTEASQMSTSGFERLYETIEEIISYTNEDLEVLGILFTKFNPRTKFSRALIEDVDQFAKNHGTFLYKTYIRPTVKMEESFDEGATIVERFPKSTAALDYQAFVDEFLERLDEKEKSRG